MLQYEAVATGKWILLGEHAVIRNHPALVFPLTSKKLWLRFSADFDSPLVSTPLTQAINSAFRGATRFFAERSQHFAFPEGNFDIKSTIPLSAGLGSSAALCVALGKLFVKEGLAEIGDLFELCLRMEDEFHGKSSGMDLAVLIEGRPLIFQKQKNLRPLEFCWQPKVYLHDTGLRSVTRESVHKVEKLRETNPEKFYRIDDKMARAVLAAEAALQIPESDGLPSLVRAIRSGEECFREWGLIPEPVEKLIANLYAAGALAVKPTGSGDGGFIISIWSDIPPPEFAEIPAYH